MLTFDLGQGQRVRMVRMVRLVKREGLEGQRIKREGLEGQRVKKVKRVKGSKSQRVRTRTLT